MKENNKNNSIKLVNHNHKKNKEIVDRIIRRLNAVVKKPSVVGFEEPLMNYLFRQSKTFKKYEVFKTKELVIVKHKDIDYAFDTPQIVSVHIDRQGFVSNNNLLVEYAAFFMQRKYSIPIKAEEFVFQRVASRHIGETIIAYDSVSGKKIEERKIIGGEYDFKLKKVFFKLDKKSNVKPGTPWMLKSKVNKLGDYISSQIDNAISVAVSFELLKNDFKGIIVFTTEEEIGLSWKHLLKFLESKKIVSDQLIVIDTTPFRYIHSVDKGLVVLRHRDESGFFNKKLTAKVKNICGDKQIPFLFKDEEIKNLNKELRKQGKPARKYGRTELGRIVEHTKGLINGTTIQIPSVNYHTNREQTSKKALFNFYLLLKEMLL